MEGIPFSVGEGLGDVGAKDNDRFSKKRRLFTQIYDMISSIKFGINIQRDVGANLGGGTVYVFWLNTLSWNSNNIVSDTFYLLIDLFASLGQNSHDQFHNPYRKQTLYLRELKNETKLSKPNWIQTLLVLWWKSSDQSILRDGSNTGLPSAW